MSLHDNDNIKPTIVTIVLEKPLKLSHVSDPYYSTCIPLTVFKGTPTNNNNNNNNSTQYDWTFARYTETRTEMGYHTAAFLQDTNTSTTTSSSLHIHVIRQQATTKNSHIAVWNELTTWCHDTFTPPQQQQHTVTLYDTEHLSKPSDAILSQTLAQLTSAADRHQIKTLWKQPTFSAAWTWTHQHCAVYNNNNTTNMTFTAARLPTMLQMDDTAAAAIHLFPTQQQQPSLWSLFPTVTPQGHLLLHQWLSQPVTCPTRLHQRHTAVAAAVSTAGLHVWKGTNTARLIHQLQEPTPPLSALYDLYLLAHEKVPFLLEATNINNNNNWLYQHTVVPLQRAHHELTRAVQLARAVLDLEVAPRELRVRRDYSDELRDTAHELEACDQHVRDEHARMNEQWESWTGASDSVRYDSGQFRLPHTNASKILAQHGLTIHKVLKNGVYFTTKELRQLTVQQQVLREQYAQLSRQVVVDAMQVAASYVPCLQTAVLPAVALLDVVATLAETAAQRNWVRPVVEDAAKRELVLQQARHPCVEQTCAEFIPNDVTLKEEQSFWFVTGPNMGGKSTYIRSIGAIVALAQMGSYIPCASGRLTLCHSILARVGAGDWQEGGVSTFMAEMLETSNMLRLATPRSLILMDELGRGTSTFDGYGLARAISEYICEEIGCWTVFATHFHELTSALPAAQNCHVTARMVHGVLTFLYQIRPGACLESFGIQVAEMAQVPQSVIVEAKRQAAILDRAAAENDMRKRLEQLPESFFEMTNEQEKMAMAKKMLLSSS